MTTQTVIEPARTNEPVVMIGGVDTHKTTHYAAAIDDHGRLLGRHVAAIGVESTGSFGATLTRFRTARGVRVVEVNRHDEPDRRARQGDRIRPSCPARQVAQSHR